MGEIGGVAKQKGLFRAFLGEATVASVFRRLDSAQFAKITDERLQLSHARVDLHGEDGTGFWRFLSLGGDVFVVLTDCTFATVRHEHVAAEGLVEFHFLLEGPVELNLPQKHPTAPSNVSLMACQQASGMVYDVICQPGAYRMASLYVRPALLEQSFCLNAGQGMARQLLYPAEGTMAMTEQKIDLEFLRVLRDLFSIGYETARALPLSAARIIELLVLSVDAIDRSGRAEEQSIVFTARELAMFSRAREVLATNFSETHTIPSLARRLGTNATKLKSGFRLLYGTTIFAYRNRHRMDRAMELLIDKQLPIAAVAHAVGFRHQASFTSAFRGHFGFTPKQARQRVESATDR
ncbi:helix-turn-helix transcriptional regulator [Pseudaminobacter sp. 19-2017]|uniref:Helix-turn-helix transcriptional regulator n=1 Tax=Pseudaminobacter soli (ex Zhang et al. 2022) TaxID=2831468 RepID=A0A942DZU6_9HYPH|nr:AraC family transcriptional regulator [Pseudaminobacter soli]MBS3650212.1 helix-turn-helix transcriptional regulator [Pseudaminobacter soli]